MQDGSKPGETGAPERRTVRQANHAAGSVVAGGDRALVIGCGALARELVALTGGLPGVDVACLSPDLHNRPERIPGQVRDRIQEARADGYERIFIAYADCGTGGLLDPVLAEEGVERLSDAVVAFEKTGDMWELHIAHFHEGCCQFGLGNLAEAVEEIAKITTASLLKPDVLEVRWAICAAGGSWEAALELADILVDRAPDRESGWIHRAYSVRRVQGGGLQKAWEALRPALEKFPDTPLIPYNLACYAAQSGRLDEAWEWLHRAMETAGNTDKIKQMGLSDSDLEPLWDRIRGL
jgi:tetratricopeptide (TPR) repeat protein